MSRQNRIINSYLKIKTKRPSSKKEKSKQNFKKEQFELPFLTLAISNAFKIQTIFQIDNLVYQPTIHLSLKLNKDFEMLIFKIQVFDIDKFL